MLEQIDLTKAMGKEAYKEKMEVLEPCLARLQRECKELGIPVLIVFEGFDASGKGVQINKLIHPLDPRGFKVFAIKEETKEESMYPFLWRFWTKTPEKEGLQSLTQAGTAECLWIVSKKRFPEKN